MDQTHKETGIAKADSWKMFDEISPRYDLLNRLLSLGLDIAWRERLKKYLPERSNMSVLDVATGTADVLLSLIKHKNITKGEGVDMAEKMLEMGRAKITKRGLSDQLKLTRANANKIPFDNNSFDTATISFGIRNMEEPSDVLKEMYRILKPQGRVLVLEFSLPKNGFLKALHLFYLRTVVPSVGYLVSGHYKAYKYLNQSIEGFPYGEKFCHLMEKAGLTQVKANPLLFGIATIYQGDKS